MRKFYAIIMAALVSAASMAQTMNIHQGQVTYAFAAAQAGTMTYGDNGATLTVAGKQFSVSEIDSIVVNNNTVADYSVDIAYSGSEASMVIAGNVAPYITATVSGAHVSVTQGDVSNLGDEVTYALSGSSTDGEFYLDGSYKCSVELNGLSLTNPSGPALNIRNGKRIDVSVKKDTENTLQDGTGGDWKGAFACKGHTEFKGKGVLNVYGNTAHGIWSKEYVEVKNCTINVLAAQKDGINCNQYFLMESGEINISGVGDDGIQVSYETDDDDNIVDDEENTGDFTINGGTINITVTAAAAKGVKAEGNIYQNGGTLNINTTGNGKYDSGENDTKASACLKADANVYITGGTATLNSTGSGGKGVNCDGTLTVDDGTITVTTSGNRYSYSSSQHSSPKGIKSEGDMTINGGNVSVTLTGTGDGCEGIESKGQITINGGYVYSKSYDDAINSKKDFVMNDGWVCALTSNSRGNDAIDANQNVYINGGNVIASGGAQPENALDAAEGYSIVINGGNVFGIGGSTAQTASSSKQASIAFTSSVSTQKLGLFDADGNGLMYIEVPSTTCTAVYMTAKGMTANKEYTVRKGVSVSGGETWNGMNTTGTISGGTNLTTAKASAQVGQGMGGGMGPGGQGGPGGGWW